MYIHTYIFLRAFPKCIERIKRPERIERIGRKEHIERIGCTERVKRIKRIGLVPGHIGRLHRPYCSVGLAVAVTSNTVTVTVTVSNHVLPIYTHVLY